MNLHQLRKKKAKAAAAATKVVEPTVVIKTKPATVVNPIKDFIKSITPEDKPDAIKPTDFIPKRKKVEEK